MSKVRLHFIGTLIFSVSSLCYGQETIPLPGVVAEEERRDSEVELFTSPYVYTESPNGLLEEPAGGLLAEPLPLDATSEESSTSLSPTLRNKKRGSARGGRGMKGGGNQSPVRYKLMWQPAVAVKGQPTDFGLVQHDLGLMAPLWISDPHIVTLSGGVSTDLITTDAVLPDSGRPFPDQLWNIHMGLNYLRSFNNGWTGGASLNIGSGSDQPFGDIRDVNFGAVAFLRVPRGERNAWNFILAYSPLSQIPFPIPMASYFWQPTDTFSMNLGLPLQMNYRPTERVSIDVSYMLLTTVHTQLTYQLNESWSIYGAFDWQNQSWFLHDRDDAKERLFSYDKRLSVGIHTTLLKHVTVDLSTGYLFDRYFFTGQNFNDQDHDRIDIGNGLFVSGQAGLRW